MKLIVILFLLITMPLVSCKKDEKSTPNTTNTGCSIGVNFFSMIHTEFGQVNSSQVHPSNAVMIVAPDENNAEDLTLFFVILKNDEMYLLSAEIKQGSQPGTYTWEENIVEMGLFFGEDVDKIEEFSITIEVLDNLVDCAENSTQCYKKVRGHYTGILYDLDTEGTSKISGEFCINK